jgi:hypothetical protein
MRGAKLGMCDPSIASTIYEILHKASNSFDKTLTIPISKTLQFYLPSKLDFSRIFSNVDPIFHKDIEMSY